MISYSSIQVHLHGFFPAHNQKMAMIQLWEVHEDLTEADFLKFLQSDGTLEKTVAKKTSMKHTVYQIDEKMNPEAMGAFERCFAVGELAEAEKIFTVSFSRRYLVFFLNGNCQ